jgi:hypothetical protein
LDGLWKLGPPEHWSCVRYEPDTPHALAAGVNCAQTGWIIFRNFFQSRGSGVQFERQGGEVVQLVADGGGDADADAVVRFTLLQTGLESREQAASSRNRQGHASKFSDHFVPSESRDAILTAELGENIVKSLGSVEWQFDCSANGVEDPTQHSFSCFPGSFPFAQLFEGHRFLLSGIPGSAGWRTSSTV